MVVLIKSRMENVIHMKRTNEKYIALNTHLILVLILFITLLSLFISGAIEQDMELCVFSVIFLLVPICAFLVSPLYIVFSDRYVEIVYNFGQREIIKWCDIRKIYIMGSWIQNSGGPPHYVIVYPRYEKRLFFVNGEIPKTRKTKRLLKRYYKKEIL